MSRALVWFRRDLRLADNPALQAALDAGLAPIPVYLHAPHEESPWEPGAASRAWLAKSLAVLSKDLASRGSRLIVRRCDSSLDALLQLQAETGAEAVFWNRLYEPALIARDSEIKSALRGQGLRAESFGAALLREPWEVETGQGEPYRVFTPFWKKLSAELRSVSVSDAPKRLSGVPDGIEGLDVSQGDPLALVPSPRWDKGFWDHFEPGEAGAAKQLKAFLDSAVSGYGEDRDFPAATGTSRLSPYLHFGEISPRQALATIQRAGLDADGGAKAFVRELGWREFSHHLLYHFPKSAEENFNPRMEPFEWASAEEDKLDAWQRGRTGIPIVDAGMRELWATGWMHNRVRMIVASLLTKNLRYHWRHGADWFWDTLVDADLASNTQGWQWTAGTGADAAPYFRIFNPVTQAERFDPDGDYIRRWVPELTGLTGKALYAPWTAVDALRRMAPGYPSDPIVDLKLSREAALAAYQQSRVALAEKDA
ncbi:MAG: deoxyribodipyrimidine photo-lyase [Lysobacteraceae bacterium]